MSPWWFEDIPHGLGHVQTRSPARGTVWVGLGDVAL